MVPSAARYGVLRSDGVSERALFIIDKAGIIQFIHVENINVRPKLEELVMELEKGKQEMVEVILKLNRTQIFADIHR